MKYCKYCNSEKDINLFRKRYDKRMDLHYINNVCLRCEADMQKARHDSVRHLPDYKEKNAERARKFYQKHTDVMKKRAKLYRLKTKESGKRKAYIEKNKEKIAAQEWVCKKRYSDFHKDNLTDKYIVEKLCGKQFRHMKKVFENTPELIEAKRAQIQLLRFSNQQK